MCTVFRLKIEDKYQVGKNYDFPSPCSGLPFWNPAGVNKTALIKPPEIPVKWASKYGNITFNQVGRDFPACGMNEKGLVVEQTTLWNTMFPDKDKREGINECIAIDLDNGLLSLYSESTNLMLAWRFFRESSFCKGIKISDYDIENFASYPEKCSRIN